MNYLIPLALETLTIDLFAEGDFYEGDLLKSVLEIDTKFWDNNKNYCLSLFKLINLRREEIAEKKFDMNNFDQSKHNSK